MTSDGWVAAVDLGATSGRVMLGQVGPQALSLTEVHRFPNAAVRLDGSLNWDVTRLHREVLGVVDLDDWDFGSRGVGHERIYG